MPENTRLIIAGGFNLPNIRWDIRQSVYAYCTHCDALLDMVFGKDLAQIVNESTRIDATTHSILDLVFMDSIMTDYSVSVNEGLSDHKLVQVCVKNVLPAKSPRETIHVKNFAAADIVSILDYLEIQLETFDGAGDVNTLWDKFKDIVDFCMHKYISIKVKNVKRLNPWVNREIIHLKRKLKRRRKRKRRIIMRSIFFQFLSRKNYLSQKNVTVPTLCQSL